MGRTQSSLLSAKYLKSNPNGQWWKVLITKLTFAIIWPGPVVHSCNVWFLKTQVLCIVEKVSIWKKLLDIDLPLH